MVEKDVEFAIKQAIDIKTSSHITITNEYRSDGIIRIDGKPVGILEFKYKRNFTNEKTRAQILCQLLCYYRKLVDKEKMQMGKNFFFILGDENELYLLNVSRIDVSALLSPKWLEVAPSNAWKDEELLAIASQLPKGFYYKYNSVEELYFGLKMLFSPLFFDCDFGEEI